ncbi:hypothetical protein [Enterococcus hirae]|nr:hypothetical protein [Enterococcus hirae]
MKTSGSSDDNKKEFFETASHVLKKFRLIVEELLLERRLFVFRDTRRD